MKKNSTEGVNFTIIKSTTPAQISTYHELPPPFMDNVSFDTNNSTLLVDTSVMLPSDVTQVDIYQYYDSNKNQMQFCITYDTRNATSYNVQPFNFSVEVSQVEFVELILQNKDPKTSRGTVTTVIAAND